MLPLSKKSVSEKTQIVPVEINNVPFPMILVKKGKLKSPCNKEKQELVVGDFYLGKSEVTQKQWRAIMGNIPADLQKEQCDACPIVFVSLKDIEAFLAKINEITGQKYYIPSETEWEYAAKGGDKSKGYTYAGSNKSKEVAWFWDNSLVNEKRSFQSVGTRRLANEIGLQDMSGNVWELCKSNKNTYVFKGGAWNTQESQCMPCAAYQVSPQSKLNFLGFRLALEKKINF